MYPNINDTPPPGALHRVCEKIREENKKVEKLISVTKKY